MAVQPEHRFDLSGGALCLDFANTVSDRASDAPVERLGRYRDLVAWSWQAGLLDEAEAAALARRGERQPEAAAAVLAEAVVLREALFALFAAVAAGEAPAPRDLDRLNRQLARCGGNLRVEPRGKGFALGCEGEAGDLGRMLGPVAWSAAELLAAGDLAAVRECAHPPCRWLFLDRSRNKSRRWCDMAVCGNRAKARRHYRRAVKRAGGG